ncbi:MAG: nicotinamide mononucleotide transporter [Acidobacteria bacterium]|nr:nicotinamide mononucleotide transporter [Acidobacteriota bacterium]
MSPLELSANIFNLISVFLANRNDVNTWWVGIIGTVLFAFLFFEVKLYADVTLQIFFVGTSIYGWWNWKRGGDTKVELPITRIRPRSLVCFLIISLLVLGVYGSLLLYLTDASYPFIDSVVLVFSVLAQLLLMSRKLETWYFWILVDIVAVPLFASKGLYLTSSIYFIFLVNAVFGLMNWRRIYVEQAHPV